MGHLKRVSLPLRFLVLCDKCKMSLDYVSLGAHVLATTRPNDEILLHRKFGLGCERDGQMFEAPKIELEQLFS